MADAPLSAPVTNAYQAATRLADFLSMARERGPILVLTGAGISTASGIGDYRDAQGRYKRPPPVTIQQFLAGKAARQRYWARSLYGWPAFSAAQPNAAHQALARLQTAGALGAALITQNVDGLHQQAGHSDVLELHGNLHRVHCVRCGFETPRVDLQQWLQQHNAHILSLTAELRPDGDADLGAADLSAVVVPDCERCGGIIKPAVVFFGDTVAPPVVAQAQRWVETSGGLLIVGSSVMIHSSFRFCRRAQQVGVPMAAINLGQTRADEWLSLKVAAACEVVLPLLEEQLAGTKAHPGDPIV